MPPVVAPGGTRLNHRNVPQKFSGVLEKVDPMQAVLQTKRKLAGEGVRPFPGRPAAAGAGGDRLGATSASRGSSLMATSAAGAAASSAESEEGDALGAPSSGLRGGGFSEDAKAMPNDLQLLVDLVGPDSTGLALRDDDLAELMRLASAAPTETPGFLRLDQSKLPLEMFDDEVRGRPVHLPTRPPLFSPTPPPLLPCQPP
jgi:hypothetical protein